MKWLDEKIISMAQNVMIRQKRNEETNLKERAVKSMLIGKAEVAIGPHHSDRMDSRPDLNFRMYKAENGFVMEVQSIDRRTERQQNKLYLIPDDQDLGQAVSHIITVESLKS